MDKFYITTPIFYVNADLHLGHAYTTVFVDSLARYARLTGREVYFLTGTDEHGATNVRSAEKAGIPIEKFVHEKAEKFKELLKTLNVSNTDFIRTSDERRHFRAAQKLWKKLDEAGDIYKSRYKGMYCVGHEAFITEKDLVQGKCADHGKEPEIIEEENYFFRLSRYTEAIKQKIESGELKILPETRKNEILSLLNEGLEDISFSRPAKDILWGVPVPGDASHTMYVWCDALANYISALGYGSEDDTNFKKFWPADLHIIGKDILRFHTAIWPGMLLSAGLSLPKAVLAHGFITINGQKMSKTLGNVVSPLNLITEYGVDSLRYYLTREISPFEDHDFTEAKFKETYNGSLANGLGNLVQRTVKMALQYFNGEIKRPVDTEINSAPLIKEIGDLGNKYNEIEYFSLPYVIHNYLLLKYVEYMENFELNKVTALLWQFLSVMDKYIDYYKPFILVKAEPEKTKAVLWNLFFGISAFAFLLQPFLPETAEKILKIIGKEDLKNLKLGEKTGEELKSILTDFRIEGATEPLFPRKD